MHTFSEQFRAVTLSHDHADLEIRENVTLSEPQSRDLLRRLKEVLGIHEALVLSTCNRTEIYYTHKDPLSREVLGLLKLVLLRNDIDVSHFVERSGHQEVTRRLFEVALGLQSQILGDMQIVNQVKRAYQWSADEDMAGPFLHRFMHTIFFTNKRIVQETPFHDGGASTSYLAKDLSEKISRQIGNGTILLVGTGEIGREVCGNFSGTDLRVYVTNRTDSSAQEMAGAHSLEYLPFSQLQSFALNEADIIVSSVAIEKPLFDADFFSGYTGYRHKYLIDLGVPRSVSEKLYNKPGFIIYNIDELEARASEALKVRHESVERVRQIMEEELSGFAGWSRELIVSPTIKKLKQTLESIRTEELERYLKNTSGPERKLLEKVTRSMMQKVLKLPVLELKAACKRGEAETLIDVLNDLFNLEAREKVD